MEKLSCLMKQLPPELAEEGTTGRDLIDNIIHEARNDGKVGYIGIDQYNNHYHIDKYPRKELLEKLGSKHAEKMYNLKSGGVREVGYVIAGLWIKVYAIHLWR